MDRIDFLSFYGDFLIYSNMSRGEVAVYAPIIYGYDDRYFNACIEYLKTGKETDLNFRNYTIQLIKNTMKASYIQALVIIHNIEQMPDEAPNIYNPYIHE